MTDAESAAKLAIYIILIQPSFYCIWKHGKTGFLGWFYVNVFCALRIVTGGIGLHGDKTSTTAIILGSIGLSPLLLAIAGVLHEARRATNPLLNRKLERFIDIQYHALIGAAMALIIVAVINLHKDGQTAKDVSTMNTLLRAGSGIIAAAWLVLVLWALWSLAPLRASSAYRSIPAKTDGKMLLNGVFVSLGLVVLRLAYAITSLQLQISNPRSKFLTSKAAEIILSMIPEILVTIVLLFVGIQTRSLKGEIKKMDYSEPTEQGYVTPDQGLEVSPIRRK